MIAELWLAMAAVGALVLAGCGPAKRVNIEETFARYYPIYEAIRSDFGVAMFETLVQDLPQRASMARVSIEVPYPPERVWAAMLRVGAEHDLPEPAVLDEASFSAVTPRFRAAYVPSGIYELYVQSATRLVPNPLRHHGRPHRGDPLGDLLGRRRLAAPTAPSQGG